TFPLDKGTEKLIVSGQISNLDEDKFVFLSETTSANREPLYSGQYLVLNDLPRPVRGAQVVVIGSDNSQSRFNEIGPGKYMLGREVKFKSGVEYHLEIIIQGKR
ncbi:MAG TPA: hypothetical protein DHU93_13635, partial [Algoriphagus sp.]|nr:hypothetical protein [Algoriphagus sp.]